MTKKTKAYKLLRVERYGAVKQFWSWTDGVFGTPVQYKVGQITRPYPKDEKNLDKLFVFDTYSNADCFRIRQSKRNVEIWEVEVTGLCNIVLKSYPKGTKLVDTVKLIKRVI